MSLACNLGNRVSSVEPQVWADLDELFIDELNTSLTRDLQELDLWLHQEIKGKFRNEKAGSGSGRVSDCSPDVES